MIDGVQIIPLLQIPDERGKVMRMLRRTDLHFPDFGEVYFSIVFPGIVKGWHLHRRMTIITPFPLAGSSWSFMTIGPLLPVAAESKKFFWARTITASCKSPPWCGTVLRVTEPRKRSFATAPTLFTIPKKWNASIPSTRASLMIGA
jgi:hypothetical protein